MAEYTVSVKGLREVVRSFNQYEGAIKDLKEANYAIGSKVSKTASAIAPNASGALAGSIRANRAKQKSKLKQVEQQFHMQALLNTDGLHEV